MNNIVELKIDLNALFIHTDDDPVDFNEALAEAVVSRLARNLEGGAQKQIKEKLDNYVNVTFCELLHNKTREILDEFLSQPVKQTDRYGDVVAHFDSVHDMIKDEYTKYITKPVDSSGKPIKDGCVYNARTYIDVVLKNMIEEAAKKHTQRIIKDTDTKIKNAMTKELRDRMSDEIAEKILAAGKSGDNTK